MNQEQKKDYLVSRTVVKKWEKEFMRITHTKPTKADIKCAPLSVKEAYSNYWKLKALELESTLADVIEDKSNIPDVIDENAKDCFNSSNENQAEECSKVSEDSSFFKPTCDSTVSQFDSSFNILNESTESKIELLTKQIEERTKNEGISFKNILKTDANTSNINTVWGAHLNKSTKEEDKTKVLERKSISYKYTEKLFKGSKFSKRNPRKPLKRSKTVGAIECDKNEQSEAVEVKEVVSSFSQPITEEECVLFGEKTKIVKTTNSASVQAVSLLQKKVDGELKKPGFAEIDKGWLDRVSKCSQITEVKKLENVSQDSGIDVLPVAKEVESDEDLIDDSDTESSKSMGLSNSLKFDPFNSSLLSPLNFSVVKRSLENGPESASKRVKVDHYEFKVATTKPEILAPKKKEDKPKDIPLDVIVQKKLEALEKKVQSGKANENFVAINIQKKVYARGKKKMTFSKYKKQKWKQMKKDTDMLPTRSRGVFKCFKCGDVGHSSKACPNPDKGLMPLEDYESEDDSPFPTLSEAAQLAEEASEKAHNGKRQFTTSNSEPSEKEPSEAPPEDKIPLPQQYNDDFDKGDIKPIYTLNSDGSTISTSKEVFDALKDFGHRSFLPGQETAIMRILSGQSTLVTLSTGSGKSLCYQLPAYIYRKHHSPCITLVVSPLISLMDDQVQGVAQCVKIASLHTNQTEKKREAVLEEVKCGNLDVLLISPETLVSLDSGYGRRLISCLPPIAFACVDEAHCLYQWCHNFRPSYMTVTQVLKEKLGVKTLLGLTATASSSTIECVLGHLGLDPYDKSGVISDTPLPDNLILSVSRTNSEEEKQHSLLQLLKEGKFKESRSIIVYCSRRQQCDRIAGFLRTSLQTEDGKNNVGRMSIHAEAYHAGLTAGRRNQVQNKFMSGVLRIVVATMAFGMGIDKNDIRGIIHYNMPSTFENYVQEVGRAGRDRKPAHCHLFLDEKKHDVGELRRHIYSNTIDRHTIRKFLQMVFIPCNCKETCPKHEVAFSIEDTVTQLDLPQENVSTLLAYLELDKKKWIKALPLAYTKCKVTSYKGSKHLKKVAKTCPPLTMAMAMAAEDGNTPELLDFDIVSLARRINWDSGVVKRTLKNLEWTTVDDKPKKSGVIVDLYNLGFRVLSPGNLSDSELDEALDILHSTVTDQEKNSLCSLQVFYNSLRKTAFESVTDCLDSEDLERSNSLKEEIRGYFVNPNLVRNVQLDEVQLENEGGIASDIRRLISAHRSDNNLTGRSIARVLHGIGSPNFPPIVWGRTKFWRLYLDQDFNLLCKLATKQLILMR